MSMSDYANLRELAEKATKGPWTTEVVKEYDVRVVNLKNDWPDAPVAWCGANHSNAQNDGAYIAACDPQTVLGLLARVDELERERDGLRTKHEIACNTITAMQQEREQRRSFEVLSSLSSYVGCGLGDKSTSADDYERRIREGIDTQIRVSQQSNAQLRRQVDILAKHSAERDRQHSQQMAGLVKLQRQLEAMERLVRSETEEWLGATTRDNPYIREEVELRIKQAKEQG